MREIKFRFLSPYTGKIVYEHDGWAEGIGINEAIKSSSVDYGYKIMQYTGLKDKNGKEIYSGDILQPSRYKNSSRFKCVVIFKKGMFCFEKNGELIQEDKPLYKSLKLADVASNSYEIIGNIYENPKLLKY